MGVDEIMLITQQEYERIYKVINTLVLNEGGDPAHNCILFSAYGAFLLEKHHNITANIRAGFAAFHVGADNDAIVFGQYDADGKLTSKDNSFHCWLETDEWAIDFMAPNFPDLYKKSGKAFSIPAQMFQKPLTEMAPSLEAINGPGDFYLLSDPVSVFYYMSVLASGPIYGDLAEICVQWYKRPPEDMPNVICIKDQHGKDMSTTLTGNAVTGPW